MASDKPTIVRHPERRMPPNMLKKSNAMLVGAKYRVSPLMTLEENIEWIQSARDKVEKQLGQLKQSLKYLKEMKKKRDEHNSRK